MSAMTLTFAVAAGGCILLDITNKYLACGFALVALIAIRRLIQRVFIKRGYREMVRLYGAQWNVTEDGEPRAWQQEPVRSAVITTI